MYFNLKFKGENKEEPLKSPRKKSPETKQPSLSNEIPALKNYTRAYRKEI